VSRSSTTIKWFVANKTASRSKQLIKLRRQLLELSPTAIRRISLSRNSTKSFKKVLYLHRNPGHNRNLIGCDFRLLQKVSSKSVYDVLYHLANRQTHRGKKTASFGGVISERIRDTNGCACCLCDRACIREIHAEVIDPNLVTRSRLRSEARVTHEEAQNQSSPAIHFTPVAERRNSSQVLERHQIKSNLHLLK